MEVPSRQVAGGRNSSFFCIFWLPRNMGRRPRERMELRAGFGCFQRQAVESRVPPVVKQLHANPRLRQVFYLNGDITFENHANILTDESNIVAETGSLSLSRGNYVALIAWLQNPVGLASCLSRHGEVRMHHNHRLVGLEQTSFCVYNKGAEGKVPAFIIGYKAPHTGP
jgi:hypothetical protein